MSRVRVTVWNEFTHEKSNDVVKKIYPKGIHTAIADGLSKVSAAVEGAALEVRTATLDQPENGLPDSVLDTTDVLVWWGHMAHAQVSDAVVERVHNRVLRGMALIVLHSGHYSKIFKRLMGTGCSLRWRVADEKERVWVVNPAHPIADGIGPYLELEREEMYGEFFDIPAPDELLFVSWFTGGNVFRSGALWRRGKGQVFYFRPGHETYPTFHNEQVIRVIANAARYLVYRGAGSAEDVATSVTIGDCLNEKTPLEKLTANR